MRKKYMVLFDKLQSSILQGQYPPGSLLPFEKELIAQNGMSRDTVRKTLRMLEEQGYINKVKGKGSVVIAPEQYSFSMNQISSFKELSQKTGMKAQTNVSEFELTGSEHAIQAKMQLGKNDKLWKVVRTREIDGEKVILDKDYLSQKYVKTLTLSACQDSIYEYIENTLQIKIGFSYKEIVVEPATEEDHKLLDVENFNIIVVIRSLVHLPDGAIFQYSESRHRPDKFRFTAFGRRLAE